MRNRISKFLRNNIIFHIFLLLASFYIILYEVTALANTPMSGQCGDHVTWEITGDTLRIKGSGKMWDYGYDKTDRQPLWTLYRDGSGEYSMIKKIEIDNGVTYLGRNAFVECRNVIEVQIPSTVKSIGWNAFYGCTSLPSVDIPEGVTKLGISAFSNCYALKEVRLPTTLTKIERYCFNYCITLPAISIPDTVSFTKIDHSVFRGCKKLTEVHLPSGMKILPSCTFKNCYSLRTVDLPRSIQIICGEAFMRCKRLRKIIIPAKVRRIEMQAFHDCQKLRVLDIRTKKLTSERVLSYAFYHTNPSVRIRVPASKLEDYKKIFLARGISKNAHWETR